MSVSKARQGAACVLITKRLGKIKLRNERSMSHAVRTT